MRAITLLIVAAGCAERGGMWSRDETDDQVGTIGQDGGAEDPSDGGTFLPDGGADDGGGATGADTGTAIATVTRLEISASEHVPAVAYAKWKAPVATEGYVVATNANGEEWVTPVDPLSLHHRVAVLGLPMGDDYTLTLHAVDEAGAHWTSTPSTFSSPSLPSSAPLLDLTVDTAARLPGFHALPIIQAEADTSTYPIVIIDDKGRVVWAAQNPEGELCTAVKFSRDGTSLLTNFGSGVVSHPLNGDASTTFPTAEAHHDFVELPSGKMAVIVTDNRTLDGVEYKSESVIEIDDRGRSTELWNLWDRLDELGLALGEGVSWDTSDIAHANALTYDDATDELVIGLTAMKAVVRFDRKTGNARWIVAPGGGVQLNVDGLSDWDLHHQIALTADGYYIYVNKTKDDSCSKIIQVKVDETLGTAETVSSFGDDTCYSTFALGGLAWMDEATLLVSWTSAGVLEQRTTSGEVLWALGSSLGSAFGYADYTPSLYP
jgi:Arylsulfotransferase (ASST)